MNSEEESQGVLYAGFEVAGKNLSIQALVRINT